MGRSVLRLALGRGWVVLPVRYSGRVEARDGVLRYDPAIPSEARARLILEAMREAPAPPRMP